MFETGELAELLGVEQPEAAAGAERSPSPPTRSRARRSSSADQPSRLSGASAQTVAARSAASSRTWKEEPQPHAATTFGLLTTKPAPWRPST